MNPYLARKGKHPIGKAGRASEQATAKRLGARATPASGAMQGAKGDMYTTKYLIEAKSSYKGSIAVNLHWLAKVCAEARIVGKTPAVTLTFTTENGHPLMNGKWVCVQEHQFLEWLDRDVK